ncbi:hypothetical protein HMPREF0578_0392 [Mobiluncus mulieris 28-1]|uniref:50S ribosomal protein L7/L12 n=1 Tax=Mobiluncus mulieris ATCC 35239 TaxID=871571 RepID=E0QTG5_9ACTO|nr:MULTISPECIES: hypothetical protein [Actinomycetaceae]EEJ53471.1 hypothetical protein HMPREF0577_1543 [Mobiluncus mulieris ATCC 35243]EEZ91355.1 hypothetical protein HMPREF0578_0392 [Mobiluncus mulieris 28-1]EFM45009.1 hypothetical protein HMPREF0580_2180 [Mobiluncus mulieris ATCC 35239]MCU9975053.1 50S ribosomal protein L7/L12 [Mobiluncus mulieris]MCV0002573.1 50S ribosomal protein L7/L12 [Mobiluncus mulieris]
MGKWFNQAAEIDKLRSEVQRQAAAIEQLRSQLAAAGVPAQVDAYGVTAEERELVANGQPVVAIKKFRERTGADLVTAKRAIDSIA